MFEQLKSISGEILSNPLTYLKTIEADPRRKKVKQDTKQWTGLWASSIIFAHIDIHHTIHAHQQYQSGSIQNSISFEFHSRVFKELFQIINQLINNLSTIQWKYILHVCLKLFTIHLQFLSMMKRDLSSDASMDHIDWTRFATADELQIWFNTLSDFVVTVEQDSSMEPIIAQQTSKAMIAILDQQTSSSIERLIIIRNSIMQSQSSIWTEQLFRALSTNIMLWNWIQLLIKEEYEQQPEVDRAALSVLKSMIEFYFNPSLDQRMRQCLQQLFDRFQQFLFMQLIKTDRLSSPLIVRYLNLCLCHVNEDFIK